MHNVTTHHEQNKLLDPYEAEPFILLTYGNEGFMQKFKMEIMIPSPFTSKYSIVGISTLFILLAAV